MRTASLWRVALALPLAFAMLAAAVDAGAAERVSFPSLDGASNAPIVLTGLFFAAPGASAPAPAIVMLHGCGGIWDRRGALTTRLHAYATFFNDLGLSARSSTRSRRATRRSSAPSASAGAG